MYLDGNGKVHSLSFNPRSLKNGESGCSSSLSNLQVSTELVWGLGTPSSRVLKIDPPKETPTNQNQPEGIVGLVQRYVRFFNSLIPCLKSFKWYIPIILFALLNFL
jgi:hypothetical protein